ncbi:hypothetical protein IFM89_013048 [Coptis chinensis]|uniref:Histone H2A n=1 Tax=Coptis chinensis TaxID=261450 RepID=A0A835GW91_9MAGN|nr:hypothetical protein IFM89_013048 [Coptis chinensis]
MEQRVENLEKNMETLASGQKKILNQLSQMSNRFNARVDLLASHPIHEAAKNLGNTRLGRIAHFLKAGKYAERVGVGVPIYLAAEVLELAGNAARDNKKTRVVPRDI